MYDVGQNLAGWAEIVVKAPAGTAVEVFYSEKLGADGRASTDGNNLVLGQLQTDVYVAKGAGEERWPAALHVQGLPVRAAQRARWAAAARGRRARPWPR